MKKPESQFVRLQLPAILWALLIFIGSSIPSMRFPSVKIFQFDKLIHVAFFFILGWLVYRALGSHDGEMVFRWYRALLAFLIVMAYGVLDEYHQYFVPGRSPDVWDATADMIGGVISTIVVYVSAWRKTLQT